MSDELAFTGERFIPGVHGPIWIEHWHRYHFAVGFAACFESALQAVARRRRLEAGDVAVDAKVMLLPTEDRAFKLAAELNVSLPQVDEPEQAVDLVRAAHAVCPYSNATRGNIDVTLTANGQPVSDVAVA